MNIWRIYYVFYFDNEISLIPFFILSKHILKTEEETILTRIIFLLKLWFPSQVSCELTIATDFDSHSILILCTSCRN